MLEPLTSLGIVRLGYADERPSTFYTRPPAALQLTETGAFALGRQSALPPALTHESSPGESQWSISDDLTVSLKPDRAPAALHDLLYSVGRLLRATPDRFTYRLTAEGVSAWIESRFDAGAVADGTGVEALIAQLAEHTAGDSQTTGVSPQWQQTLRAWNASRGQLHLYEDLTLIEFADDYALQELLVSTTLADYLVHQFSPRLVAIDSGAADVLLAEMQARGYTPRIE
jgi:hypothetical protein